MTFASPPTKWLIGIRIVLAAVLVPTALTATGCFAKDAAQPAATPSADASQPEDARMKDPDGLALATFGNGCFWCTEAVFQNVKGVHSATSGYSGGHTEKPSYEEVCAGITGHAEVIQLRYDPQVVSYSDLLEVFWKTHDPTTKNRQGNDVGTQYRSAVFYHDDQQRQLAEHHMRELDESGAFDRPIVTEITAYETFYPADDYHQNFFNLHGRQPYCAAIIRPKVEKFKKAFPDKLKDPVEP